MAKIMHPVFEIYESLDEAIVAVRPRTPKAALTVEALEAAGLQLIRVSQDAGLTLVGFPPGEVDSAGKLAPLRDDLAKLADLLPTDSKVLVDFTAVPYFDAAMIEIIALLARRLKNRGSRIALVCVSPEVLNAFLVPADGRRTAQRR